MEQHSKVRTRRYIEKFYGMRTQLQAVSLRLQTMSTNQAMAQSMKGATKVCRSVGRVNPKASRSDLVQCGSEGNVDDVKTDEYSGDATHPHGIRKGKLNDGHEGGDDERCG